MNEERLVLLEATHKHISTRRSFKKADGMKRVFQIITQMITTERNIDLVKDVVDVRYDVRSLLEFEKSIRIKYVYNDAKVLTDEVLKHMLHDKKVPKHLAYIKELYDDIIDTDIGRSIMTNEVVTFFDPEIFFKDIYDRLSKDMKVKMPGRSLKLFWDDPSKYIAGVTHVNGVVVENDALLKIGIVKLAIGIAFLKDEKLTDYIKTIVEFVNQDKTTTSDVILNKLHDNNVGKKMIYVHRMSELNALILEFIMAKYFGFNMVIKSVVDSIIYCKANGIKTFLQITNVIMNNLIVISYTDKNLKALKEKELNQMILVTEKDNKYVHILIDGIASYIVSYYENEQGRLCAHDTTTAMKQALSSICKYDKDIFTLGE